jgi:hypothetical protein
MDHSNWKTTIIRFVAWMVASLGMVANIYLIREAVLDVMARFGATVQSRAAQTGGSGTDVIFAIEAFDRFLILALSLLAVGLTVWVEYYLRNGEKRGELLARLGKVFGVEVAVTVIAVLVQVIA